jgi:hypothetical protein
MAVSSKVSGLSQYFNPIRAPGEIRRLWTTPYFSPVLASLFRLGTYNSSYTGASFYLKNAMEFVSFQETDTFHGKQKLWRILRFVDRASLYNLVNKANLVHSFS